MAIRETEFEVDGRSQLTLGPGDEGKLLGAEEYAAAIYDEPWTYERIHGRLAVMSPEGRDHARKSAPWRDRLGAYALAHPDIVEVVVSQAWVVIDADNDRIGDIGVYLVRPDRAMNLPDQPPDLMFEIVSPGAANERRDYVEKRHDYHRAGIREYVIIDRFRRTVTVLTLAPDGYEERVLTMEDMYETPLLPGFSVRLAEVLG